MIWTIAFGILLGYLLIDLLPVIFIFIGGIFKTVGGLLTEMFKGLKKTYTNFKQLKWYYKLLIYIGFVSLCVLLEWYDGLIIAFIIFSYYVAIWFIDLIKLVEQPKKK